MLTTESHASGVGKLLSSTSNCDDIPGYVEKSMSSIDTTEKSNWTSISSVEFEVFDEEDAKSVDIHEDKALLPRFDQCSQKELRELLIERLNVDFTDKSSTFPSFRRDEVKEGRVLGRGEWGTVSEIRRFFVNKSEAECNSQCEDSRSHLSTDCFREGGDCRFVIKRLKYGKELESVDDPSFKLAQGGFDLAVEAAILSNLNDHPNIIKMHAIASEQAFGPDSFLVLDRLYYTLHQRLIDWRQQKKQEHQSIFRKSLPSFFGKQVKTALGLSSALAYFHDKRVIHRDLKPQNIGFDLDGNTKVFDFAMARIMPRKKDSADEDCRYNFTRMCGSLRYSKFI